MICNEVYSRVLFCYNVEITKIKKMEDLQDDYLSFRAEYGLRIADVPERILFDGPTVEVTALRGQKLTAKSQFYPARFSYDEGNFEPLPASSSSKDGYFLYMTVVNDSGEEIGLRVAKISCPQGPFGWKVQTKVIIKDRGKGYAKPVDSAFTSTLQWLADSFQSPVTWEIFNENLANLESYRAGDFIDPGKLRALELEQERWQALYGEGGYFGIKNGRKVFTPVSRDIPAFITLDLRARMVNAGVLRESAGIRSNIVY